MGQETSPTTDELRAVQNYLSGTFLLQNSTRGRHHQSLSFLELHGLGEDHLRHYVQHVSALTPGDIQRMAKTYLRDADMTVVVVGDRSAIVDQIRPFGEVRDRR